MSFQYLFHSPPVAASQASNISLILIFLPELPFFQAESWCLFFPPDIHLICQGKAKAILHYIQSENNFLRVAS